MTGSIDGDLVPWSYSDSEAGASWSWLTEHFIARIAAREVDARIVESTGERIVQAYAWELSDLMRRQQEMPRLLIDGMAATFEEASWNLREHIGKAYDPRLGYQRWCGAPATTFTLATGERIDIRPLVGTRCALTIRMPGGERMHLQGMLSQSSYRWHVTDGGDLLEVLPEHVERVTNRSEAASRAADIVHEPTYSGIARIYLDDPRTGCTGVPGFEAGTVDHSGQARCPVHEATLPEDSLR